jgi:hypothetical protein
MLDRDSQSDSELLPFIPALRIDGQSLPQGKCISPTPGREELHLHEDQVIKDHCLIKAPYPTRLFVNRGFRETDRTSNELLGAE